MRAKGIDYDTGFSPVDGSSRTEFDPAEVRREMRMIAEQLHCTAVRITGGEPERIGVAAEYAAEFGLEVWFSPFPCNLTTDRMGPLFLDCAHRAERLRAAGARVVLVLGCELTLFADGFLPGGGLHERIAALGDPGTWQHASDWTGRLNTFLAATAAEARAVFGGPISYASGVWEQVDWTPFDYVAVDAYRDADNAPEYRDHLRRQFRHGKPVVISEFGCCTYTGAADRGGMGWTIVDDSVEPRVIRGDFTRDEEEQVRYLHELLPVFEEAGVDAAFWFTYAHYRAPHHPDPRRDLDLASYGVVKLTEDGLRPKAVFHALSAAYRG